MSGKIGPKNVGRIAEGIVANELEYRGFRVSYLDGRSRAQNADLIASNRGITWQVQVKGASQSSERWWVQYGFCTPEIVMARQPMFNRRDGAYKADIVCLVAVRSPNSYRCIVLKVLQAEEAARINIDRYYLGAKLDGSPRKAGKVWVALDATPREAVNEARKREREILLSGDDNWSAFTV